jgi:hypothetical protein
LSRQVDGHAAIIEDLRRKQAVSQGINEQAIKDMSVLKESVERRFKNVSSVFNALTYFVGDLSRKNFSPRRGARKAKRAAEKVELNLVDTFTLIGMLKDGTKPFKGQDE